MYAKIITNIVETEEGEQQEVKSIQTLDILPKQALIPNYKHTYKVMEDVEETYTEDVEVKENVLVQDAVYETQPVLDEEGNALLDEEGNAITQQVLVSEPIYEEQIHIEQVEKTRLVPTEVTKEVVMDAVIYSPTKEQLGYEIIQPEERENYTWELQIVNDEIEVVYTEIPQPTEEELVEQARLEAEAQAEAERIAEEKAEQARLQAIANRENYFNNNFFETSLGYISEIVHMSDNTTKSFLFDLLPTIVLGVNAGQQVQVIAYNKPDSFENEVDYVSLQHVETATSQFLLECMQAVNTKFRGNN